MKRALVLFSCIITISFLSLSDVHAQNQIGLYVTPLASWVKNPVEKNRFYNPKLTFSAGIGADFIHYFDNKHRSKLVGGRMANDVRSRWALRAGLHYFAVNQKWDAEYRVNGPNKTIITKEHTGKIRLDYLKVLIAAQYIYPIGPKLKTKYFAGIQPGYLLKGDGGLVAYEEYTNHDYFDLPESKMSYYNRFSLDFVLAGGFYYRITRWWNATCMARFDIAMLSTKNLEKIPDDVQLFAPEDNSGHARTMTFGFMIGAEYSFHKAAHSRTKF